MLITSFTGIALFWGTADCSNDAIWGVVTAEAEVSTPETAWLLLAGLGGIGGIRPRRT